MSDSLPTKFDTENPEGVPGPGSTWKDWLDYCLRIAASAIDAWYCRQGIPPKEGEAGGGMDPADLYVQELAELTNMLLKALGAKQPGTNVSAAHYFGYINFVMPKLSSCPAYNLPVAWSDQEFDDFYSELKSFRDNPTMDYYKQFGCHIAGDGGPDNWWEPEYSLPWFKTTPPTLGEWCGCQVEQGFSSLYSAGEHNLSLRGKVGFYFTYKSGSDEPYHMKVYVQMLTVESSYSGVWEDITAYCGVDIGITIAKDEPIDFDITNRGDYQTTDPHVASFKEISFNREKQETDPDGGDYTPGDIPGMAMRFKWGYKDPTKATTEELKDDFISKKFTPYVLFDGSIPWRHNGYKSVPHMYYQLSASVQIYRYLAYVS